MLLFKILGLLLILGVCVVSGFLKADVLKKRSEKLQKNLEALNRLGELVRIGSYEIEELVMLCFSADTVAVEKGHIKLSGEYLLKEDIKILEDFFRGFGMADREAEYERTKLFYSLLENQYSAALGVYGKLGRLYRSIGFMGGLILCIFLM